MARARGESLLYILFPFFCFIYPRVPFSPLFCGTIFARLNEQSEKRKRQSRGGDKSDPRDVLFGERVQKSQRELPWETREMEKRKKEKRKMESVKNKARAEDRPRK